MMKITVCFLIWAGVQVVASQSDYEGNGLSEDEFGHYMGWKAFDVEEEEEANLSGMNVLDSGNTYDKEEENEGGGKEREADLSSEKKFLRGANKEKETHFFATLSGFSFVSGGAVFDIVAINDEEINQLTWLFESTAAGPFYYELYTMIEGGLDTANNWTPLGEYYMRFYVRMFQSSFRLPFQFHLRKL
uniref:Uncharacterized protein n=1 Tax=Ditylum brightwellii TaxID=49249 RepID=A0A7S4R1I2_9STRA|mmetsp:Transcript_28952/g.43678  ORF Transcript_28952/g.43678 Transcript_28952/m.43678 type:complete len:189 (-) Transcript_28952:106-672(-)